MRFHYHCPQSRSGSTSCSSTLLFPIFSLVSLSLSLSLTAITHTLLTNCIDQWLWCHYLNDPYIWLTHFFSWFGYIRNDWCRRPIHNFPLSLSFPLYLSLYFKQYRLSSVSNSDHSIICSIELLKLWFVLFDINQSIIFVFCFVLCLSFLLI